MLRLRQFVDCTPDTVPDGLSIMLLIQTGREMLPTPQFRSSRTTLSGVLRIRQVLLPPCFMPQKCSNPLLCPCCGCCRGLLYEEPYIWSPRVRLLIVSNPLLCPCGVCVAALCGEVGSLRGAVVATRMCVVMHCAMAFWWGSSLGALLLRFVCDVPLVLLRDCFCVGFEEVWGCVHWS